MISPWRLLILSKIDGYLDPRSDTRSDTVCFLCWSQGPATGKWKWNTLICSNGMYQMKWVKSFYITPAYERLKVIVLANSQWESCPVYLDDAIAFEISFDEVDSLYEPEYLGNLGLKRKVKYCSLFQKKVLFL